VPKTEVMIYQLVTRYMCVGYSSF